ncbi:MULTISPECIES: DUF4013 domain-containing protein [Halorussus]|uniref:DUF4013 domain-containing protein n=1 Tax=Halorussus TaxID=1070314 RepID=UPI0020A0FF16|nr:DUF4013 domain-containing protein [Halorussus vallis]USZ76807.1 DUF4013 domain-containing protein [Halorussus vallis]
MFEDALSYPTNGESGVARILIGGVLGILAILIIPSFILYGYMVQAMTAVSRGEDEPPAFEEWGDLLVDGVKAVVIGIAYSFVPFVLMVMVFVAMIGGSSAGGDTAGVAAGLGLVGMLVALVLSFAIQYVLPAALTNFGREGSIGAAFDFDELKPVLLSGDYLKAVVLTFGIALVGGVGFLVFALVTLGIGYILAPFFYFWLYLAGSYMFGTAYANVSPVEPPSSTEQVHFGD